MNIKERFVYKASIGFALGIFVDIIIKMIFNSSNNMYVGYRLYALTGNHMTALMLDFLLCGLFGMVCNGGSVVYEIESWGVLKATLVHFISAIIIYFIAGNFLGWFGPGISFYNIIQVVLWIFVYAMIWLIQYVIGKKEIREINRSMELIKQKKEK